MATTNIQTFDGQVEVNSNLSVDTNTLHVDSVAGRVGIGKTDPAYAMDVNGTVNASALYVDGSEFSGSPWTESDSNIYYTGGNVGIGTTAPQKTLEVAGPMRITDGGTNVSDLSVGLGSWTFQSKITAPDRAQNDQFSRSASISGDGSYAIAGASGDDGPAGTPQPNYGAAYIFVRSGSTWTFQSKITAPDRVPSDRFGSSVSISGDGSYALVGAYGDDSFAGSAYIFRRSGTSWIYQSKITAPERAPDDQFGGSVSISSDGSYAISSMFGDDGPGCPTYPNYGSAYIFSRSGSTWTLQKKITAPDAYSNDSFGYSASLSGDGSYAIAGAWGKAGYRGAAYIWVRSGSTWTLQSKITAPSPEPYEYFGRSVSISGDGSDVIASAYGNDAIQANSGASYIFRRSGTSWSYHTIIKGPDPQYQGEFGDPVSISGDGSYALVGWFREDDPGPSTGSALIYNLPTLLNVSTPIVADGSLLSFTGQHICFPEGPMGQGLVVSANKNKYVSLNGSLTTGTSAIKSSEALPVVSLSNVANDRSVFGVVDHFEQSGTTRSQTYGATVIRQDKESGDNRVIVNSLGEGAIWVANTNGNVVSGDFLTTSHLPGYAQRQEGHIFKSYTVAKSTMDCDFEPEDLPVQAILKDDDGNNVLDSYGRLQWVDSDRTEPEYRIRYLDVSGTPTDEANAVHKAAYVGCTYHCG